MNKITKILCSLAVVLVAIAPFITNIASACQNSWGETVIPEALKE